VYFEMVLKGSTTDLWIRNVQLSLFSLLPALVPIIASNSSSGVGSGGFWMLFANFGAWAWATVAIQVFGGLVTAVVIKYADNILKGFATSLSIVISFLASIALFNFHITLAFVLGSSTVLAATWLYNKPESKEPAMFPKLVTDMVASRKSSSYPGSPIESDAPILGDLDGEKSHKSSLGSASPRVLAAALKLVTPRSSTENLAGHNETVGLSEMGGGSYTLSRTASSSSVGLQSAYYSNPHSRPSTPPITFSSRPQSSSQLAVPSSSSRAPSGLGMEDSHYAIINLDDSFSSSR